MTRLGKGILVVLGLVLALVPVAWAGSYTFVDIDYPLSGATITIDDIIGLNNLGQIVGSYTLGGHRYAFIKNGGTYSTLTISGSATNTIAIGINDAGQVVGNYDSHGFMYDTATSNLTPFNVPSAYNTTVWGINDIGQVAGYCYITQNSGFIRNVNSSNWTYLNMPAATLTLAFGINDQGIAVGTYTKDGHDHGFIYNGTFQTYDVPGAQNTRVVGINDHGDIVGRYWNDNGIIYGFVYHNGNFESLAMPGARVARVLGINNARQIVGLYTKDGGTTYHGFLGTPVRGLSSLFLLLND